MKKTQQKLMKHRISCVARVIACASFLVLTIIGVSSLVRAMSLENIANENGIPSIWQAASLGNPETITIPITYWDQRMDDCSDENRQFEWTACRLYAKGIVRDVVKSRLGADGLPIPTYTNSTDAWAAYHDVFTANVTGQDPVQPGDNFYRWFHETTDANGKQLSKRYDREVIFKRTGKNTYEYGSRGTFPLDDVNFSKGDSTNTDHNFHFTAHMQIPMKIAADGSEQFWFSGDDDVWVFLNGQLVLDLGGLHMDTEGYFVINADGSITSVVQNVNDQKCRQEKIPNPNTIGYDIYNNRVEQSCPRSQQTYTINAGLQAGNVVNLDFFYAERSTTESNTRITISNMNWPISADSELTANIVGTLPDGESNLIQYQASIANRDPERPLDLLRLAAHMHETKDNESLADGFLKLDASTLSYTTTPDDENSWQPVEISAPDNTANGFTLATPLHMSPSGQTGDTLYFRYMGETTGNTGAMTSVVSFYTSLNGTSGVTYDYATVKYKAPDVPPTPVEPDPPVKAEHTVKIEYRYADETKAADDYTATIKEGDSFSVDSPEIKDYAPTITTVSGTMGNEDLTYIVYYNYVPNVPVDPEEPDTHTVTIHYIYEDGTTAAEPHVEKLKEGDSFSIDSPLVPDHTPDHANISGTVGNEDLEYIVRYKREGSDLPPVGPTEPTTPEEPSEPDTPNEPSDVITPTPIPPSDILDGGLLYLDPLGEVAFVPNTGIIDEAIGSLFTVGFAEMILSQGFVMVMLLIFAGSFATYFSLRQYINLETATHTNYTTKRMPRANNQKRTARASGRGAHAKITRKK